MDVPALMTTRLLARRSERPRIMIGHTGHGLVERLCFDGGKLTIAAWLGWACSAAGKEKEEKEEEEVEEEEEEGGAWGADVKVTLTGYQFFRLDPTRD